MMHLVVFPVKQCFFLKTRDDSVFQYAMYYIPIAVFIVDIIIGFNTGIFEFGLIVTKRRLISKAYFKDKLASHAALTIMLVLHRSLEQNIIIGLIGTFLRLKMVSVVGWGGG